MGEKFPSPGQPMKVARQLEPDWLNSDDHTLLHWRGQWMQWRGSHWAEVEDRNIRAELYERLENAYYTEMTRSGPEDRPWAPTRSKISDLAEALAAIIHIPETVNPPCWLNPVRLVQTVRDPPSIAHAHTQEEAGPTMARTADRADQVYVATANGLLDVTTRTMGDHTPTFYNLVSVPFEYDPETPLPRKWLEFLNSIWPDDPESVRALQEWFGYVLSGRTDLHKVFMIVGPTRSGKGTIARILGALIGKSNMAGPTLASLGSNFGLSPLLGKPLAVISDARLAGSGAEKVTERLLTISGEDTIDIDRKYRDVWTGTLPTRIMILSNELPNFGDSSGVIAHRFVVLQMAVSWLGKEKPGLTGELVAELPGILNWSLDGLERLAIQGHFTEPMSSADAVTAMKDASSPMAAFVRDECIVGPDCEVDIDDLYAAWRRWCIAGGHPTPSNKQMFGRDIRSVVPQIHLVRPRGDNGVRPRRYSGIRLRAPYETGNGEDRDAGEQRTSEAPPTPPSDPLWTSSGTCPDCSWPIDSEGHETTCEGVRP